MLAVTFGLVHLCQYTVVSIVKEVCRDCEADNYDMADIDLLFI